jgi:hypothetical protein
MKIQITSKTLPQYLHITLTAMATYILATVESKSVGVLY